MKMELNGGISKKSKIKRLKCSVQTYGWGRIGSDTAVARMYAANSGGVVDSSRPYAEFWMGTHESGPSFVVKNKKSAFLANGYKNGCLKPRRSGPFDQDVMKANGYLNGNERLNGHDSATTDKIVPVRIVNGIGHCDLRGETLKSWIEKNPSVLGDKVLERWGCDLPFMFKVLSIAKPLSIQAHPDKVLARELHKLHPNLYKDDNHKPEMALALTEFEALCGFLEIKELKEVLRKTPEIEDLVGNVNRTKVLNVDDTDEENIKAMVKLLFTEIMSASKNIVTEVLAKLKSRLYLIRKEKLTPKEQLVLRLEEEYPNDVGVIAAFFMNYVKLKPGEALYLGANELHAYVSGDCIECMATSDNVVRAGLTPKKRDVETLCSMLTYNLGFPHTLKGTTINKYTKSYRPPFEEFEVDFCEIPEGGSVSFSVTPGPSIFVIMEGNGVIRTHDHGEETAVVGDVLFTPANIEVSIKASRQLKLYRAGVNSEYL
ncbi:hypothetical protein V2J09_003475 [Rumex salicifolius]